MVLEFHFKPIQYEFEAVMNKDGSLVRWIQSVFNQSILTNFWMENCVHSKCKRINWSCRFRSSKIHNRYFENENGVALIGNCPMPLNKRCRKQSHLPRFDWYWKCWQRVEIAIPLYAKHKLFHIIFGWSVLAHSTYQYAVVHMLAHFPVDVTQYLTFDNVCNHFDSLKLRHELASYFSVRFIQPHIGLADWLVSGYRTSDK